MKDKDKNNEEINIEQLKSELKEQLKKEVLEEMKDDKKDNKAKEAIDKIMNTEDNTKDYTKKDIDANKGMAMISYLGPLAVIPIMTSKDSKFTDYHAKQGLNLFVIELIVWLCNYFLSSIVQIPKMCTFLDNTYQCGTATPWWLSIPLSLVEIVLFALSIIGFVWAYQGKAKELPIIGKFKIIK